VIVDRVLILGARSWVGFRLREALLRLDPCVTVEGTTSIDSVGGEFIRACSSDEFESLVRLRRPDAVVNLLRGENELDRDIHLRMAAACTDLGLHYVFASSALVLDGYEGAPLSEEMRAKSVTPYGQFKGACESDLVRIGGSWLVLRFASIHGWSPWRPSRTELFLRKVCAGETVVVDRGVLQNRLLDLVLAEAAAQALLDRQQGILHLGAIDNSEEGVFLRRVADAFGQPAQLVVDGPDRNVNLVTEPVRLRALYPGRFERTESQTIDGLLACPHLQHFRKH
jgi:dTDP-4-dehydrorhamnose reductase